MGITQEVRGVNLIGYFQGSFGLGEAARLMIQSLQKKGIPFTLLSADFLSQHHHQEAFKETLANQFIYPINLFCIDPRHIIPFVAHHGKYWFTDRYNISVCFWETNRIPKSHLGPWNHLDEIWAPTRYVQEHLSINTSVPVYHISQPVHLSYSPIHPEDAEKQSFGLEDKYTFLFCFCFYSVVERKNPIAIIKAFQRAFPNSQDVQLVLKSQNGHQYPAKLKAVLNSIKGDPRIIWIDESFSSQRRYDLMQACDCYISLHRSEGFGLTMAEALLLEKPVIATGYSGNLDFMTEENSFLCPYRLIRIGRGNPPYSSKGVWADVDIDQAAFWMDYVVKNQEAAKAKARQGKAYVLKQLSCERVGEQIGKRLEKIVFEKKEKSISWIYYRAKILQKTFDCFPFLYPALKSVKRTVKTAIRKFK